MRSERTLTVSELMDALNAALKAVMPYGVWVAGEISGITRPKSGHVYFDLVESSDTPGAPPRAKVHVALLSRTKAGVNATIRRHGNAIRMTGGVQVRIRGRLDCYAPTGRLQFLMTDIDPTYTLGRIAADRDIVLQKLSDEGILRRNADMPLPDVPLRVGLVTSGSSAAHADVLKMLANSGFAFTVLQADVRVQGTEAPPAIAAAVADMGSPEHRVDVVILARGGGSKTELAAFDHESVARSVAMCPLPVFTGIGHEIDRSASDGAAHTACPTPTAAAEAVVGMVAGWLHRLDNKARSVAARSQLVLANADRGLHRRSDRLAAACRSNLRDAELRVSSASARIRALDPATLLRRGWSITRRASDGTVVRSTGDTADNDILITQTSDGMITSIVMKGRGEQ